MAAALCSSSQFHCESSKECIFQRYICDGVKDCRDGSDETVEKCGLSACYGKIICHNTKRCIPFNWCCDPRRQETCDQWRLGVCCQFDMQQQHSRSSNELYTNVLHRNEFGRAVQIEIANKKTSASSNFVMGYQSAIFLITGCTLAFICLLLAGSFLATKLVIRRMKRSRNIISSSIAADDFSRGHIPQLESSPFERGLLIVSHSGNRNSLPECSIPPPPPYVATGSSCVDLDSAPPAYGSLDNEATLTADPPPAYTLYESDNVDNLVNSDIGDSVQRV